jgi:hypothetical protein
MGYHYVKCITIIMTITKIIISIAMTIIITQTSTITTINFAVN